MVDDEVVKMCETAAVAAANFSAWKMPVKKMEVNENARSVFTIENTFLGGLTFCFFLQSR